MGVQQMEEQKIKEGLSIWLECKKIKMRTTFRRKAT